MAAPLCDASGRTIGMVLVFRDISDAIKMQAERARADKLASLGLLAGGIALFMIRKRVADDLR